MTDRETKLAKDIGTLLWGLGVLLLWGATELVRYERAVFARHPDLPALRLVLIAWGAAVAGAAVVLLVGDATLGSTLAAGATALFVVLTASIDLWATVKDRKEVQAARTDTLDDLIGRWD